MDQAMGGEGQFPLEEWFWNTPTCTRWWTTATFLTSALVQFGVVSPFQLFYSYRAVFYKHQYWRLVSSFIYFGPFSLDLIFNVYFLQRYSRLLEESSGRSPAHFAWLLFCVMASLIAMAPVISMPFLGHPLSSTLVYIWSRRNPNTRLSFLGVMVFTAPYLPWVLMLFSLVVHGRVPKDEIIGVVIGHVWYFFNDLYPPLHHGQRPLDPPAFWCRIFDGRPAPVNDNEAETEQPPTGNIGDALPGARPGIAGGKYSKSGGLFLAIFNPMSSFWRAMIAWRIQIGFSISIITKTCSSVIISSFVSLHRRYGSVIA